MIIKLSPIEHLCALNKEKSRDRERERKIKKPLANKQREITKRIMPFEV